MNAIAVTGPRRVNSEQDLVVKMTLDGLLTHETVLYVGDATGVDDIAWRHAWRNAERLERFCKKQALPPVAQGAERSTRMIKAALAAGATLHAWPNKPCPPNLKPSKSWPKGADGSGTWGTIALAVGLGMPVVVHPLADLGILPTWLGERHLAHGGQLVLL